MLQSISKYKLYFYIISFLFISTMINYNILNDFKKFFLISNIQIKTNFTKIDKKILTQINYLFDKNIFFIKKNHVLENLIDLNFLENIEIKKNYPSTILIKATKTNIIGMTYLNQKKYYVGLNGRFIYSENLSVEKKVPLIFGIFQISEYIELLSILKKQNINAELISKFYFHKNKRWDLYFKDNTIIKLPNTKIEKAIENYKNLKKDMKPNTIIDLRIANRIIIKND
tara:strand:- start:638 stop:1321 length:684 start_codon:yes stop_codon:yes gene_type:complete